MLHFPRHLRGVRKETISLLVSLVHRMSCCFAFFASDFLILRLFRGLKKETIFGLADSFCGW